VESRGKEVEGVGRGAVRKVEGGREGVRRGTEKKVKGGM
jgi:hypothetical protein